jgi:hypothetical protein
MAKTSSSTPTREEFVSFISLMDEITRLKDSYSTIVDRREAFKSPDQVKAKFKIAFEKIWDERLDLIQQGQMRLFSLTLQEKLNYICILITIQTQSINMTI